LSQQVNRGKMDILRARSRMSGRPNGRLVTDRGRNGIEGKEV
jgi:hypothetical protein